MLREYHQTGFRHGKELTQKICLAKPYRYPVRGSTGENQVPISRESRGLTIALEEVGESCHQSDQNSNLRRGADRLFPCKIGNHSVVPLPWVVSHQICAHGAI